MTATSVAFFRNLNLGQPRSPSRDQILAAFAGEGATDVLSHQSNGTVAFKSSVEPQTVVDGVVARLGPVCDYAGVAFVRPVRWLDDLSLDGLPDGCELTLFDGPAEFPAPLPHVSERAAATILAADRLHAIVQNHVERRSNGTPLVESLLDGVPATSRGVETVLRLLARL